MNFNFYSAVAISFNFCWIKEVEFSISKKSMKQEQRTKGSGFPYGTLRESSCP